MLSLFNVCFVATVLFIWFKTDAIVEWGRILGLKGFLNLNDYHNAKISAAPYPLSYPMYLRKLSEGFFTKLMTCPACFAMWQILILYAGGAIMLNHLMFFCLFPIGYVFTLVIYGIVCKCYQMAQQ